REKLTPRLKRFLCQRRQYALPERPEDLAHLTIGGNAHLQCTRAARALAHSFPHREQNRGIGGRPPPRVLPFAARRRAAAGVSVLRFSAIRSAIVTQTALPGVSIGWYEKAVS